MKANSYAKKFAHQSARGHLAGGSPIRLLSVWVNAGPLPGRPLSGEGRNEQQSNTRFGFMGKDGGREPAEP